MKKLLIMLLCLAILAISVVPGYAEIRKGAKGEDVVALQERLIELGFLDDVADGAFGKNTEKALIAFQEANGLEPTGIATIKDINVIFSDDAREAHVEDTISSPETVLPNSDEVMIDFAKLESLDIFNNPSESYIIEKLSSAPNVAIIAAVSEENDPNGNLGKAGGYTAQVYFSSPLVSGSYAKDKTTSEVIDGGTDCGGSIEVYATPADAIARDAYLGTFDGTAFSSGSHKVVGTIIIRTSSQLTASEQKAFTEEIIIALTSDALESNQPANENAIQETPSAELPMLSVVESGFAVDNGFLYYAVKIHNNSDNKAVEYPEIKITTRDKDGILLSVDTQVMSVIYPGQDLVWAGLGSEMDEIPHTMDVEIVDPEDYNIVSPVKLEHPEYIPLEIKGAKFKDSGYISTLIGEVYNPNDYGINSFAVVVVFRDTNGNLCGGDCGFADGLSAGGFSAFEVYIGGDFATENYEVYATPW